MRVCLGEWKRGGRGEGARMGEKTDGAVRRRMGERRKKKERVSGE
jgi:hypothetical protein